MFPRILAPALLLLGIASAAHATAVWAPGVNLRWDRCFVDGGVWNKTFACNTNAGTEELIGSFELAATLDRVVTATLALDIRAESATLPAWWSMRNLGTCRPTALDFMTSPTIPSLTCVDWSASPTGGGISAYSIGLQGPSHVRLNATVAVTTLNGATLFAGQEYFLFSVKISHAKTVGADACGGCNVPMCIFLSRVSLYRAGSSTASIQLDRGANYLGSQYVTWQNGYPIDVHRVCDPADPTCAEHYTEFGCVLATPTRSRATTWGQLKSLYR